MRYALVDRGWRIHAVVWHVCDQEDQYGNMTCQQNQQTQGLCPQHGFNTSTNQINNSGYSYDAAGAVAPVSSPANSGDGDIAATEKYDAEGRLISVDSGNTAKYVYNAFGERVGASVDLRPPWREVRGLHR